jgi:3-oxoacyl-(acyl-carrier-protein) synthase
MDNEPADFGRARTLKQVVITGLGCITAAGDWCLCEPPSLRALQGDDDFAIGEFALGNYLQSAKTYLDRCSALALAGMALALRDAGHQWPPAPEMAPEFGITLGTHLGCLSTMKTFWDKIADGEVRHANPILFSHSYFNSPISLCAIEYGLKGYHSTVCTGEGGGIDAIRAAFDAIVLGHAQAMVCGGVDALTDVRSAFEPAARNSEAAAFVVLESAEYAAARGAAHQLPIEEAKLCAAADTTRAQANFGRCGAALSALALAELLPAILRT